MTLWHNARERLMKNSNLNVKGSVLLLGKSEELVYIDRKMLRVCGVGRPVFSRNGAKTARFLGALPKSKHPAFIFCTEPADMDSLRFLGLIRLHPDLLDLPLILVTDRLDSQVIAETSKLGSCALLVRPYTQKEMENAILSAGKEKSRLEPCPDASMFKQALAALDNSQAPKSASRKQPAENMLLIGKNMLRQGKYQQAISMFIKHLQKEPALKGEALHGIALAKENLGLAQASRDCLQQAAVAYIEEENFMPARALFAKLRPQGSPENTDNPLYHAGARLLKEGRFAPAALAFMQGQMLTPNMSFYVHAARACQFACNPEKSAEELCWHVERRSPRLGRQLRNHLFMPGSSKPEPEPEPRSGLWGRVCEAVEVARYTAKLLAAN